MYTDKKNILELVALLREFGIKHVVVCPGSRNAPIIQTFVTAGFCCYTVVDERSAGFFALGIIQKLETPVVVCCTSGTALLNLEAAVAEAFYQQLPLLVVSADRTAPWIGQMDGQTLPQPGVFGQLVKLSVNIPEPYTPEQEWYVNRRINEALIVLTRNDSGPVHINVPLAEPLFNFPVTALPHVRAIHYSNSGECLLPESYARQWERYNKILIIVGQYPGDPEADRLLYHLSVCQNCVVVAEHLSNLSAEGEVITNFDRVLYAVDDPVPFVPELLVTFGGHIVSKRIKQFLRRLSPQSHWHLSATGELVDLYQSLTDIIKGDPLSTLRFFTHKRVERDGRYRKLWKDTACALETVAERFTGFEFSDLYITREFLRCMPSGSVLHVGNSSAVRNIQLFGLPVGTKVLCNRGTNGIDGSVSTAVGYAAVHSGLTFLLIGDLSFFYDMNGLWNSYLSPGLRILLINNGGGGIFQLLPGLEKAPALQKYIAASHTATAQGWVESLGINYLFADSRETLSNALETFTTPIVSVPMVLEVKTWNLASAEVFRAYFRNLKQINQ